MAPRDQFDITIKCPNCGNTGYALVSESDYPTKRDTGFEVDQFPTGFRLIKRGKNRGETEVQCQKCGQVFKL